MVKELKDHLTTETILKRFESQFDVVLHAITIAENMVRSGRPPAVKTEIQNPAHVVLAEILNQRDMIVSIETIEEDTHNSDGSVTFKPMSEEQTLVDDEDGDDEEEAVEEVEEKEPVS